MVIYIQPYRYILDNVLELLLLCCALCYYYFVELSLNSYDGDKGSVDVWMSLINVVVYIVLFVYVCVFIYNKREYFILGFRNFCFCFFCICCCRCCDKKSNLLKSSDV